MVRIKTAFVGQHHLQILFTPHLLFFLLQQRSAEAFLLVYSITDGKSLQELTKYRNNILRAKDVATCPMVLFGNKCDMESMRQVSKPEGQNLAKEWGVPQFEGSAKTAQNISESFTSLVQELKNHRLAKDKKKPAADAHEKKGCCILM